MGCRRRVGHAIKVPGASPTNLTSDVGTGTSTSACLTSSTTTLEIDVQVALYGASKT